MLDEQEAYAAVPEGDVVSGGGVAGVSPASPARLVECREVMGWSRRGLADLLDEAETVVRRWETGEEPVWPEVMVWLERRAAARRADPPPSYGEGDKRPRRAGREAALPAADDHSDAARLRRALGPDGMHVSISAFGGLIGLTHEAIRRWASGIGRIRPEALAWAERQAKAVRDDPPPRRVASKRTGLPRGLTREAISSAHRALGAAEVAASARGDRELAKQLHDVADTLIGLPTFGAELRAEVERERQAVAMVSQVMSLHVPRPERLPPLGPRPPGAMTAERMQLILDWLGWSQADFVRNLGHAGGGIQRLARRWLKGKRRIPSDIADWLEALADVARARPAAVTELHRQRQLFLAWREDIHRQLNVEGDKIEASAPPETAEWDARLLAVIEKSPPPPPWASKGGGPRDDDDGDEDDAVGAGLTPGQRRAIDDLL